MRTQKERLAAAEEMVHTLVMAVLDLQHRVAELESMQQRELQQQGED